MTTARPDPRELIRQAQANQQGARFGFLVAQANARMAQQIRAGKP